MSRRDEQRAAARYRRALRAGRALTPAQAKDDDERRARMRAERSRDPTSNYTVDYKERIG